MQLDALPSLTLDRRRAATFSHLAALANSAAHLAQAIIASVMS
jgi:hypothetical protein